MATRAGCEIGETPNSAGCDKYTLRCFLMLFSSNQMLFKPLYAFVFTDHDDDIIHRKNMSGIDVSHRLFAALNVKPNLRRRSASCTLRPTSFCVMRISDISILLLRDI